MHSSAYHIELKRGRKIFFRYWHVDQPKACVCIVHGLGDHSGRYEHLVKELTSHNIAVCAIDYLGHGNANGVRGHIPSYTVAYDSIEILLSEAGKHYINVPLILYGHSMGGNLVLNYFCARKPIIKGLIVTSPWLKMANPPLKAEITFARIMQYIIPRFTINNRINSADLTRDKEILAELTQDQLVHNKISLRLFTLAFSHGKRVSNQGYKISIPMLLMHGDADNITSHKASVNFTRNTGSFTTFKSWPGAYHELHNDINRNDVFSYILQWINEKIV